MAHHIASAEHIDFVNVLEDCLDRLQLCMVLKFQYQTLSRFSFTQISGLHSTA